MASPHALVFAPHQRIRKPTPWLCIPSQHSRPMPRAVTRADAFAQRLTTMKQRGKL